MDVYHWLLHPALSGVMLYCLPKLTVRAILEDNSWRVERFGSMQKWELLPPDEIKALNVGLAEPAAA